MKVRVLLRALALGAVALGAAVAVGLLVRRPATPPGPGAYVANAACLECHAKEAGAWRKSHHAQAMAVAADSTVFGDFTDATFTHAGVTSSFFRRDGRFFVHTDGPDGALADFEITHTFGYAPLQQYLIAMPGGRLQPLQIAWDRVRGRWFRLLPDEKAPPGDVLHWTGRYQTANTMCISCHTTGFEKRYDAVADTFASRWAEPNVSCQSCHGPGERHVAWARRQGDRPVVAPVSGARYGLSVDTRTAGPARQLDVCAPCHARRSELTAAPGPGEPLLDHYLPSRLEAGLYHPDGQQLDEVFVYGSYRQSRMHQAGVTCTDCHDPHSERVKLQGNALCQQCHATQVTPRFPRAAGNYDTPAHHFHQAGTAAAQCVSCHMPAKNYMQIQPRLDHSLRVPRPDLSVKLGTPNACNGCHADKSAQWAADRVVAWYGPKRRQDPHYGEAFFAAHAGRPGAAAGLVRVVADPTLPAIVRAAALDALRGDGATGMAERVAATRDGDPEVRAAAAASLESAPGAQRAAALVPLLSDPIRAVRIEAAKSLSSLRAGEIDAARRPEFDAALAEYIAAQNVALDMPGARLNLAVVHDNLGRRDLAEQEYLQALRIDPDFTPARANLARRYNAEGRNADAERVLVEGLARNPGIGELQYSLALLLVEEGRLPEAVEAMERAARLLPQRARVRYNLGLLQQQLGRGRAAEEALLEADRLEPGSAETMYALAVFYAQGGRRALALEWAEKLQARDPANPEVAQFVAGLRAGN